MTDKTRWLGLGPWHEDNESELIDWTAQPQYKGLVKGDYYHAELRYSGRWGDPGHKGELDVVFDDDGKIAFAEFNETTMGNYYVRHFQNVSKRRTEFQFFQDFHDKRRSVAYGRVLANGFKYVEDQILEKQDLDADYDLLTGASFSMKNMIGLKNDVSAQRKDSNHKKQRYYGYTEDYGYGITGWLQVVVEDGKIVRCFYDEIFADHTKDIVYDDLKQFYRQSKYFSTTYEDPFRLAGVLQGPVRCHQQEGLRNTGYVRYHRTALRGGPGHGRGVGQATQGRCGSRLQQRRHRPLRHPAPLSRVEQLSAPGQDRPRRDGQGRRREVRRNEHG